MAKFLDAKGATQEVNLEVSVYREAADNGMTVAQLINTKYQTDAEAFGSAFDQFAAESGLFVASNPTYGIKSATLADVFSGKAEINAGTVVRDANPTSRILFPAVFLEAVENKLKANTEGYVALFDSMVAIDDSIAGPRFEQPILNYSQPEGARSKAVSQLAEPNVMLGITVGDIARKIPTFSLGLEVSTEALQATTLDFVTLAIARQAEVERAARVDEYIQAFLNGDVDMGTVALSSVTATSLDATIASAAGILSHKAWIKWLRTNFRKRNIDFVMCDLATALSIENRTGRPTITNDDPNSPRINATAQVMNPAWQNVQIFLLEDGVIPTNTIIGIDSRYAIRRVRNSQADYAAVEQFVLRKAEAMRYDFAETAYRMFDEAFSVLTLT
jgi:hypothetical protein